MIVLWLEYTDDDKQQKTDNHIPVYKTDNKEDTG